MFFEHSIEKNSFQPNESQRRQCSNDVLNQASEILEMTEVQDALERLDMGRLPHLLSKMYIPTVEDGTIHANKDTNFVPLVSIYPQETLILKNTAVSLDADGQDGIGMTISNPQMLVALAQANANSPTAPMALIHETVHVNQLVFNTVNDAAYRRYPKLGSREEVEALNVEAVVADILIASRHSRWYKNSNLLTPLTAKIHSRQPVIPYPRPSTPTNLRF